MVIVGRKTYFSFPEKLRPLKDRINIIVSRDKAAREYSLFPSIRCRKYGIPKSVHVCHSIDEALILTQKEELKEKVERIFVIGGGEVYKSSISLPECEKLYITEIDTDTTCDTFLSSIPSIYKMTVYTYIYDYLEM